MSANASKGQRHKPLKRGENQLPIQFKDRKCRDSYCTESIPWGAHSAQKYCSSECRNTSYNEARREDLSDRKSREEVGDDGRLHGFHDWGDEMLCRNLDCGISFDKQRATPEMCPNPKSRRMAIRVPSEDVAARIAFDVKFREAYDAENSKRRLWGLRPVSAEDFGARIGLPPNESRNASGRGLNIGRRRAWGGDEGLSSTSSSGGAS